MAPRWPRRAFLAAAGATAAAAVPPAGWPGRAAATGPVVVRTTAGPVAGVRAGGCAVFRGLPYAAAPVGPLRFASPRPPRPWRAVRDASRPAPAFLQQDDASSREDALYADAWTPDPHGRRPVLVYVHGGGWQVGSGSLPTYDGARLAVRGDLVVVTFNYRLGPFGFGLHEELGDDATGSCANWGLQDQIALLRWVRDNAPAFGGDPHNVTLCGTSAGGASAWQLTLLPETRDLVRRAIPISACHVWSPATAFTRRDSVRAFETLASRLGVTVAGLRGLPAAAIDREWRRMFAGPPDGHVVPSGREYRGPVPDGRWMRDFDHRSPTPGRPLLVIYTRTEGSFYTGPGSPIPSPPPVDDASLRTAVRRVLGKGLYRVPERLVEECVGAYRAAAAADGLPGDPFSLWTEVWGDALFRHPIVRLSERHAHASAAPQYVMEFAFPFRAPWSGTPHEATSKFLFGTYGLPENVAACGDGPVRRRVSDAFIDVVASFARTGTPSSGSLPRWPVFSPDRPSTLVLGEPGGPRVARTGKAGQLRFWDEIGWPPRP
ncbi:carboxylic ester hydrolase [Sphaerisporangium krabiense]|uniref:Carboxylic ester hydrolase n=1 Tax=Sphaerisporangium krabiense TaxID=763782 RepID=A0A7W8YZQ7_9ACTN|nr:carboxylesterase family protein [Sphaerisporangium krabiense]MBB5624784.1 para-nitrobenzyl esterase [Sphaerisporangium krabiense]GII66516.1 carboxylic ester hydrolase [Sphaerisporangium krabiense]